MTATAPIETRIAAAEWYLAHRCRVGTAWSTDPDGTCRCPKARACPSPGKHPVTAHGFHDAMTDPVRIRTLLAAGSEPNLYIVPPDGCFGWDLDGDDAVRIGELEAELGPLPATAGTDTPHGRHARLSVAGG